MGGLRKESSRKGNWFMKALTTVVRDNVRNTNADVTEQTPGATPRHSQEHAMNKVRQQLPTGSKGIAILAAATALTIGLAFVGGCEEPSDSDGRQKSEQNEAAGTARAVKETALASTAIMRLSGTIDGDDGATAPLAPDPTPVQPDDGDGIGEVMGDLLEGLLGF